MSKSTRRSSRNMDTNGKKIILASNSPRRKELLSLLDLEFSVDTGTDFIEEYSPGTPHFKVPELMSRGKSLGFHRELDPDEILVTSDTMVLCGTEILGKPRDEDDARRMIRLLSGREPLVFTGVTRTHGDRQVTFHVRTGVTFYPVPENELDAYVRTPEPYDKAGGYAIQGGAAVWIEKINGDYYNVVGFPVARVHRELLKMGLDQTEGYQ